VGNDDVANAQSSALGHIEIGGDISDRINDRSGGMSGTAKKVGNGNWISVQILAKDHGSLPG
jgi:hypothetical protein